MQSTCKYFPNSGKTDNGKFFFASFNRLREHKMHRRVFRGCETGKLKLRNIPIVVTTVLEKKNDCPKLQEATAEPFFSMLTPRLLAFIISCIKSSNDESANQNDIMLKEVNIRPANEIFGIVNELLVMSLPDWFICNLNSTYRFHELDL